MVCLSSQVGALGNRIFLVAQALAVFPFRLKHDGLSLDPVLLVYTMVTKLALGIHLLFIEESALFVSSVAAYFAVFVHSIIVLFKKDTLNTFLKLLSDSEFSFLQLGKRSVTKTNDAYDYLLIIFNILTTLLDSLYLQEVNITTLFKIWLRLSALGVLHPFLHLVLVMQRRFSNLNEMIEDSSRHKVSRFQALAELHQRCVTACLTLNDCFTQQILWIVAALFLFMTVTSYQVFIVIEADSGFFVVAIKVFRLLYFIFIAYTICMICEKTSMEAKKFDIILHRLLIVDVTHDLVSDDKLFYHIAMKQEIYFSANNVFSIDCTLIHSMISAATTYLVILIQMN
ncbi:Gustatory receptor 74 [Halyomorpha halys]|nr:Gustatory receptor 74 [Halyomorpha halys]